MHEPPAPARFGRYEILAPIAAGGMAEVFAARAVQGARGGAELVAIKVMREELLHEERFAAMFLDEARVAANIEHPNVVGIVDLGRDERGVPYLAMDLVIGASVSGLLKGEPPAPAAPLPVALAVEICIQAAEGLEAAHEAKDALGTPLEIVHRDISPQNILVGVDGRARITDFGIARAVARLTRTQSGEVKGKARYFSPEQASAQPADRRADVWALGVVLWEVLTLRPLFTGRTFMDVVQAVTRQPIDDVRRHRPEVPAAVAAVIAHALERDPARRPESAAALAEALREAARAEALVLPDAREIARYVLERAGGAIYELTDTIEEITGVAVPMGEDAVAPGGFDEEPTTVDPHLGGLLGASRPRARPLGADTIDESASASQPDTSSLAATIPEQPPSAALAAAIHAAVGPRARPERRHPRSQRPDSQRPESQRPGRNARTLPLGVMSTGEADRHLAALARSASASAGEAPIGPAPTSTSPREGATTLACPRCGREVAPDSLSFDERGARVCKACHSEGLIAQGDRRAVATIAGMGYGALLSGLLALFVTWVPWLNLVPATLAVASAVAFFLQVSRSPEHRRTMGWQLPVATVASAIGLALGLLVPITYALMFVGLAAR